ncbi:hypothetical protein COV61_01280 [Candidatus Micrarchaeota archaeon CG11_big_fil_rev_8_21_14_0_20_47_5]|nr:MAG: hypothetical protein AUJ17_05710 [Candidatus Micrarchaeota archaeon CG1_02_47_40]PIN84068.1 MAG: hypothetical protein COV61_01280 [Candidatus Micrarchaeota archaeon CG11_big_fil_rev_8_21_14_0_20_47_5]
MGKFLAFIFTFSLLFSFLFAQQTEGATQQNAQISIYFGGKLNQPLSAYVDSLKGLPPEALDEKLALAEKLTGREMSLLYAPEIGEYGVAYESASLSGVFISVGKNQKGGFVRITYPQGTPRQKLTIAIAEELSTISKWGVFEKLERSEIQSIKDMLDGGSDIVVYAGGSEGAAQGAGTTQAPQGTSSEQTSDSQTTGGTSTSQTSGTQLPPSPPQGSSGSGMSQESAQIVAQVLESTLGSGASATYQASPDGNWIGIQTGTAALTSTQGTLGEGMKQSGSTLQVGNTGAATPPEGTGDSSGGYANQTKPSGDDSALISGTIAALAIGAVFFSAFALIIYQIFFRPQMMDYDVHKALSNETRVGILSELSEVEKIPTDLSSKLDKSKATIAEHLERLVQAGLVEKIEKPGRKFVFYRITSKGRSALRQKAG